MEMPVEIHRDLQFNLGEVAPASRQDEAETLRSLAPLNNGDVELLKFAQSMLKEGFASAARQIVQEIVSQASHDPVPVRLLRDVAMVEKNFSQALRCAQICFSLTHDAADEFALAQVYYEMEKDRQALDHFLSASKGLQDQPQLQFEIFKTIGNIFCRGGDFESAQENYDRAFLINAQSDSLMVNYGTLAIQRGDLEQAAERFRSAVQENDNNDKAWVGLAIVHRQMGDLRLAWANIERALDINPGNRTAIRLLMEWSVIDHRIERAVPKVQEYLTREFEDGEVSFDLAKLHYLVGQNEHALIELERVLALDPGQEEAVRLFRLIREGADRVG